MKRFGIILLTSACVFFHMTSIQAKEPIKIVTSETYTPVQSQKDYEDVAMNSHEEEFEISLFSLERSTGTPYWVNDNGMKSFYDAEDNLIYKQGTKKVIDVSKHNGTIDWESVKASDVDGAIIRLGFGDDGNDEQFKQNVSECNRLGIPYGVYLYSYADNANIAYAEAEWTAKVLSEVKLNLSYPIYYDIEGFKEWKETIDGQEVTHTHPNDPEIYNSIISTYINRLTEYGYGGKVHVYSYRSYLQKQLNHPDILKYVSWMAAYTKTMGYTNQYYNGIAGWQYTSSASIPGISHNCDVSCFYDQMFNSSLSRSVSDKVNNYLISKGLKFNNGFVTGFTVGDNISNVANMFKDLGAVACFNTLGNSISDQVLSTGQRIAVTVEDDESVNTYIMCVIIKGDVNGDGNIYATDYVKIKNYIMGNGSLEEASVVAADVNGDGQVYATDYVKIKNHIMGKSSIVQ